MSIKLICGLGKNGKMFRQSLHTEGRYAVHRPKQQRDGRLDRDKVQNA